MRGYDRLRRVMSYGWLRQVMMYLRRSLGNSGDKIIYNVLWRSPFFDFSAPCKFLCLVHKSKTEKLCDI